MIDERDLFVRAAERFDPPEHAYQRFVAREDRHQRNRRTGAIVVAIVVIALAFGGIARAILRAQRQQTITPPPAGIFGAVRGWVVVGTSKGLVAIDPNDPTRRVVLRRGVSNPIAWSRDGTELLFGQMASGGGLGVLHADGTVVPLHMPRESWAGSFTADGREVLY